MNKKEENIETLFKNLEGTFDTLEPAMGHQQRFLDKLNASKGVASLEKKRKPWWKPLSIAASIALLCCIGIGVYQSRPSIEEQVAEISPEVSNTEYYFASLIEEQIKKLESESTPQTKKMVDDTMQQLQKLKTDYNQLEKDLLNGGNSKMILSAMITNFQTRIDLLRDVLNKIETIKNLKNYDDANYTM
ncbi:hypothetical protein [Costertonia aggregata]|uniref:DUF4179 domain-containing protein n=1 Tax=Costertonia aggregata TaxID=343403 RepID=A0A7H9ASP4_9FLAO|nr:hypothetical protein [Costertonia aggregata]QLG46456.1 hypothetical protein HYG79_14230 [Costertonia aggregata]